MGSQQPKNWPQCQETKTAKTCRNVNLFLCLYFSIPSKEAEQRSALPHMCQILPLPSLGFARSVGFVCRSQTTIPGSLFSRWWVLSFGDAPKLGIISCNPPWIAAKIMLCLIQLIPDVDPLIRNFLNLTPILSPKSDPPHFLCLCTGDFFTTDGV